jgi:putative pyoverdin transport system ATP-binding/permease protein
VTFLRLFGAELASTWRVFVILALISGLANGAVLATINRAAATVSDGDVRAQSIVVLGLAIVVYSIAQRSLMLMAATLAEQAVDRIRVEVLKALQSADLADLENLNRNEIYTCVNTEMQIMADGVVQLVMVGQALVLVVVTMLYMAWLSLFALAVAVIFLAIAAYVHLARAQQIIDEYHASIVVQTQLADGFTDFVEGFKEVKLNATRSRELGAKVDQLSRDFAAMRLKTRAVFATDFVASQVAFFLLTGTMVLVVPMFTAVDTETIVMTTASVLFLIGPITAVISGVPILQRVNAAAEAIISMRERLSTIVQRSAWDVPGPSEFEHIRLDGVTYQYRGSGDEAGFVVGPIDLEIRRGQVIFVTGGNGSGKSTLLKLITGLYLPSQGVLRLDARAIGPENAASYRNMFSAIFSDNHLFRELYGVPAIDSAEADELFRLMEMERKTRIVGKAFDTVVLSSGQRKRLAMIATLLEHRPICVFDEWAADQDPHFREKFYRVVLPRLRAAGITILAVTHDERYFDAADFRVHLEEGRLSRIMMHDEPGSAV